MNDTSLIKGNTDPQKIYNQLLNHKKLAKKVYQKYTGKELVLEMLCYNPKKRPTIDALIELVEDDNNSEDDNNREDDN